MVVVQQNELSQRLYVSRYTVQPQGDGPCTRVLNAEVSPTQGAWGATPAACMGHDAEFLLVPHGGPVLIVTERGHQVYNVRMEGDIRSIVASPNSEAWACVWQPSGQGPAPSTLRIMGLPYPFCPTITNVPRYFHYR